MGKLLLPKKSFLYIDINIYIYVYIYIHIYFHANHVMLRLIDHCFSQRQSRVDGQRCSTCNEGVVFSSIQSSKKSCWLVFRSNSVAWVGATCFHFPDTKPIWRKREMDDSNTMGSCWMAWTFLWIEFDLKSNFVAQHFALWKDTSCGINW